MSTELVFDDVTYSGILGTSHITEYLRNMLNNDTQVHFPISPFHIQNKFFVRQISDQISLTGLIPM